MMPISPYGQDKYWKNSSFRSTLIALTKHHHDNCEAYRNILATSAFRLTAESQLEELPFLPVSLFKYLTLVSVPADKIQRTLTSSGTSRQLVSKIYLDSETSVKQMQALTSIVADFLGRERLPMLAIDNPAVLQNQNGYSARVAAIQGFSLFGKNRTFALGDNMQPDIKAIENFLQAVNGKPFFLFGFTFIIWQHLFKYLQQNNITLDLSNGILIHGGGWKRLAEHEVSDEIFRHGLQERTGLQNIYSYYGMVEQTGSIYMQCEHKHFHCSNFSDIFIRRVEDFSVCEFGEPGIIQTISALPHSYPGHNLLTEDEGVLVGEDDCPCGRYGKYFTVVRRLLNAELKGCGDAYATN